MHSAGFVTKERRSPIGLGGAVAVHAIVVVVYILTPKEYYPIIPPSILLGTPIEAAHDPDPPTPPEPEKALPRHDVTAVPKAEVNGPTTGLAFDITQDPDPFTFLPRKNPETRIEPTPEPILAEARPDPRYLRDFQPDYPTNLQRLEMEGSVTVRVKVGPDGRVMSVQLVSATHDDFFKATERQALRRWRFRPATRDGQPVESWREMTVHFRLED